jgi:hypothetical protein
MDESSLLFSTQALQKRHQSFEAFLSGSQMLLLSLGKDVQHSNEFLEVRVRGDVLSQKRGMNMVLVVKLSNFVFRVLDDAGIIVPVEAGELIKESKLVLAESRLGGLRTLG